MDQRATTHRIGRDPDSPATLSMAPKDGSASDHASNSKRSRLTNYIVDTAEAWISQRPCIEFEAIQTYALYCRCHRRMDQRATMHPIRRDPDLRAPLPMAPKDGSASDHASNSKRSRLTNYVVDGTEAWISERPCIQFEEIQTYALHGRCHREMDQQATMHRVRRDPDLRATLSMAPKDASASDHASNSKRSRLTGYVVDATKGWISERPCIEFEEIQTYVLRCRCHRKMNQQATMHPIPGDLDLRPTLWMPPKDG